MTEGPKKNEAMKQAAADCVSGLTKNSIVEGSQLWPDDIQGYGLIEKLHACLFLGYADIKPEEKLKQLEERGLEDARHISEQSHNDQLQMLGRYIERSGKMRDIAAKHGIDYVDFSNWEHYEAKKDELISKILGWLDANMLNITSLDEYSRCWFLV